VISGDTLVDFDQSLEINERWLRPGVTREQIAAGQRPLLDQPVEHVLPTHGVPTDRASLGRALSSSQTNVCDHRADAARERDRQERAAATEVMRLAVQTPLVPGSSLAEQWEIASRLGFDALELAGPAVPRLAEEVEGSGIPISALCGGQRGALIHPERARIEEFLADSPSLLDAAAALDAPLIVVRVFGYSQSLPPHARTGRSREEDAALFEVGLRTLTELAEARDVRLLVEPLNRYETPVCNTVAEARAFAEAVGSPAVVPMADVFHMQIEEADPLATLAREVGTLGYVHLADSNRLEPGQGHTDFAATVSTLAASGYDGYLGLECRLSSPGEATLGRIARHLRELMDAA